MRRLAALVALGLPLFAAADIIGFGGGGFFLIQEGVAVPAVIGEASFAAADAILEGDGLDGFEVVTCSSAASGEVVNQAPPAGTLVQLATVVSVYVSSGTPCRGRPQLWLGPRRTKP